MAVKIVHGDLLTASEDILCHQVNCQGVMGSGLALQIKTKYPFVYKEYKRTCDEYGSNNLGTCLFVKTNDGKVIANLFGQDGFGRDKQHTDESELKRSLSFLAHKAKLNNLSVALPYKLGSDRGGADWNKISAIIEDVFSEVEVTIYKLR